MAGVPAGLLRMTRNLNKPPGLLQEIRISNRVEGAAAAPGWPNRFDIAEQDRRLALAERLERWLQAGADGPTAGG
jgi:hypothetical protein